MGLGRIVHPNAKRMEVVVLKNNRKLAQKVHRPTWAPCAINQDSPPGDESCIVRVEVGRK